MRGVRRRSVTFLWVCVYYDYPRAGFCEYGGHPYFFRETAKEFVYELFPLKDKTWAAHLADHQRFKDHVGEHWDAPDYDLSTLKPQKEWGKYYDEKKEGLPKGDELPPAFWFYDGTDRDRRRMKFRRRRWRLENLMEKKKARFQSSTGT